MSYANTQAAHTMTWPITSVKSVTPSDTVDLVDGATRGILVTAAGNVAVITKDGDEVTLPVTEKIFYPVSVGRIKATGTTATGILALY